MVKLWAMPEGRQIRTMEERGSVKAVAFSPDGETLAVQGRTVRRKPPGLDSHSVQLLDIWSGNELYKLAGDNWFQPLMWSPDGTKLANTCWYDRILNNYDAASGKQLHTKDECQSYAWSPDSKSLAVGTNDGTIDLLDVASWRQLKSTVGYSGFIVQGSNTIKIWDIASGKLLRDLKGHIGGVCSAVFTPDGKMIISASLDTTIRLWNTASGSELARLYSFGSDDWAVVTPDGHFDATPGAMKMLYRRDGNQILESDDLKKQFYVPGLLRKTISSNYTNSLQPLRKQDRQVPQIEKAS
jgi:WD40 repeat protein